MQHLKAHDAGFFVRQHGPHQEEVRPLPLRLPSSHGRASFIVGALRAPMSHLSDHSQNMSWTTGCRSIGRPIQIPMNCIPNERGTSNWPIRSQLPGLLWNCNHVKTVHLHGIGQSWQEVLLSGLHVRSGCNSSCSSCTAAVDGLV